MKVAPELDSVVLFMLFILPGLISIHIYRLLLPAKDIDWKNVTVQALFYSCLNFVVCLPILVPIHRGDFPAAHPYIYVSLFMVVLLVSPVFLPFVLVKLFRWERLMNRLQLPYPTAWDYFFDLRKVVFVLIHLKNGRMIGGYYGPNSYATSFPREGDIYLEAVFHIDKNGRYVDMVKNTAGLLIRHTEYDYIEFHDIPESTSRKESHNGKEGQSETPIEQKKNQ